MSKRPRSKAPKPRRRWVRGLALAAALAIAGVVAHALWRLPSASEVAALARHRPRTTALIEARAREARRAGRAPRRDQRWVNLDAMAPELLAAVVASEDARFFVHDGVDLTQLRAALIRDVRDRHYTRGASTITQQLAKNLWLTERKSVLRKLEEGVLAHRLEEGLSKARILELYLNEVEWGRGIYGVGAASRAYFDVDPRGLSLAQSAILAAMLPAPRRLSPTHRSRALWRRAGHVLDRVAEERMASPAAVREARAAVDAQLEPIAAP